MNQQKVANLLRKSLATFSGKISNLVLRVSKTTSGGPSSPSAFAYKGEVKPLCEGFERSITALPSSCASCSFVSPRGTNVARASSHLRGKTRA